MASLRAVSGVVRPLTSVVRPKSTTFETAATTAPSTKLVSEKVTVMERRIIKFSSLIRCTPFDWDSSQDSFVVTWELQRFVAMYLNFACIVGYEGYLVTRFVQNELHPTESYTTDNAFLTFLSLTILSLISYQLAMFARFKEMPNLHRRAKRWFARIDRYLDEHADLKDGVINKYANSLEFGIQFDIPFTTFWVFLSGLYPSQKIYLSSAIGGFQNHYFWHAVFNMVTFGYVVATLYATVYVWSTSYMAVALNLSAVLRIIRKSVEKEYPESFIMYREAQVMVQEFNSVCSTTIMPAVKWLTVFTTTYILYTGVMSEDLPTRILMVVFFISLLPTFEIMFSYMGKFWTESNSVIQVATGKWSSSMLSRRRAQSLAPIKADVCGCYFIDEISALVVLDFIITSSAGLVMAGKS